jgi:hypothetical protein
MPGLGDRVRNELNEILGSKLRVKSVVEKALNNIRDKSTHGSLKNVVNKLIDDAAN